MSVLSFILCYLAYAFACACFIEYLYQAAGAPHINEHNIAHYQNGLIFSFWGRFVANGYNRWQEKNKAKIWELAGKKMPTGEEYEKAKKDVLPIIAATAGVPIDSVSDNNVRRFLQQALADEIARHALSLNPYKPLGVCPLCTAFWVYTPLAVLAIWALSYGGVQIPFIGQFLAVLLFPSIAFVMQQKV